MILAWVWARGVQTGTVGVEVGTWLGLRMCVNRADLGVTEAAERTIAATQAMRRKRRARGCMIREAFDAVGDDDNAGAGAGADAGADADAGGRP